MSITALDANDKPIKKGSTAKPERYQARWREADGRQRARRFVTKREASAFLATVTVDTLQGRYVAADAGRELLGEYGVRWARERSPGGHSHANA